MTEAATPSAKVLFVDDDASFLEMVRDVFSDASQGAWQIQTATGGGDGLQHLRRARVDLVVIDVFMPGMDGLQLLRVLNEEFPSLPKVLLTGAPEAGTREAALEGGAALFLEKPASAAGYASVFATLNELLRWHQRFSTRGALRSLTLLDLVKLECKSGNSRRFEVFIGETPGEIYIENGAIIHALMPGRRGQSAFTFLTTTPRAVFYLRQYVEPIERSIDREWEFIVMEAAQIAEQLAQSPPPPEPSIFARPATAPTPPEILAPPALKVTAPAPLPAPDVIAKPVPVPVALPPQARIPLTLPARSVAPTPLEIQAGQPWQIAAAPEARPMEFEADPAGFRVEEMLLCTDFREVLFESHCPDPAKRLALGEATLQKANELARSLPLGELDRAELQSSGSRLVLRFEAKRCLLVRTNTRARPPLAITPATETAAEWLGRQPLMRGLLAAGVLTPDGQVQARSFVPDFSADILPLATRETGRLLDLAMRFVFPAWQVRLLYARTQLYTVRRQDGVVLSAFLLRNGHDAQAVQSFFDEFRQVRYG